METLLFMPFVRGWQVPEVEGIRIYPPISVWAFLHCKIFTGMLILSLADWKNRFNEVRDTVNWEGEVIKDLGQVNVHLIINSHFPLAELLQRTGCNQLDEVFESQQASCISHFFHFSTIAIRGSVKVKGRYMLLRVIRGSSWQLDCIQGLLMSLTDREIMLF